MLTAIPLYYNKYNKQKNRIDFDQVESNSFKYKRHIMKIVANKTSQAAHVFVVVVLNVKTSSEQLDFFRPYEVLKTSLLKIVVFKSS